MRYICLNFVFFMLFLWLSSPSMAQEIEPDFIGEAYIVDNQGKSQQLDKEIAAFTRGASLKANSWDALSLEIQGEKAKTRVAQGTIRLIVRAADNNSDPISIIRIYRLNAKKKKRTTILSENNSGTFMKSRTHTKNLLSFSGKKFGESSYALTIADIKPGEYGITVVNPNNMDEKQTIISCFGVD